MKLQKSLKPKIWSFEVLKVSKNVKTWIFKTNFPTHAHDGMR